MSEFKNKAYLVGGCLGTVGSQLSFDLAAQGGHVYGYDIHPNPPSKSKLISYYQIHRDIEKLGIRLGRIVDTIREQETNLAGLICTQGTAGEIIDAEQVSLDFFHECVSDNLSSVVASVKAVVPWMKSQQHGSIVALGSTASITGVALMPAYSAAKHAVLGLVRSYARELGRFGIRVNAVLPGALEGPLLASIIQQLEQRKNPAFQFNGFDQQNSSHIPLGRLGRAEDVSKAIQFLLSSQSSYCTGISLVVDGGVSVK
jgi:NAD(P)-dependent dehydrogenase (short-subunit alcohol dehydrogenase family)